MAHVYEGYSLKSSWEWSELEGLNSKVTKVVSWLVVVQARKDCELDIGWQY